jgi:hypothetical protein
MNTDTPSEATAPEAYPLRDAVECTPRRGLPNFFARLQSGQEVKIAYLGGSITAAPGWRVKTLTWFQQRYPNANVSEVNAAISGTGSGLGAFRLEHDVLRYKPDLLLVEFAVNDSGYTQASVVRSMEGIVRQAWQVLPEMDICYVYTLAFDSMVKQLQQNKYPPTASAMEAVADHYGIPSIHVGLEIARLEEAQKLVFQGTIPTTAAQTAALGDRMLFSEDAVHPLIETGHVVYTRVVGRSMERIVLVPAAQPGPHTLGLPLVSDNWEQARMLPLSRATLSPGWQKLDPVQDPLTVAYGDCMPELWKAEKPGESLTFRFKGTCAWIYDLVGPDCGAVRVKLDDQPEVTRLRFDAYCIDHRICWLEIASGLPDTQHTVTVTVDAQMPDKMSILFEHNRSDMKLHPAKYEGTTWYAGALMIIGELA